jgi:hypothetical protein
LITKRVSGCAPYRNSAVRVEHMPLVTGQGIDEYRAETLDR